MLATTASSQRTSRATRIGLGWLFGPLAVLLIAFLSIPLLALAWRAIDSGELQDNLTSGFVLDALRLSAITSTFTLLIAVITGTPLAYLLARRNFRGKFLVDMLIDLPIVLPPTVAGVALLVAFGRRGVVGEYLDDAGINIAFTTTAVILAQLFVSAPFYIRTAKAGFESVDTAYEGVASTLGRVAAARVLEDHAAARLAVARCRSDSLLGAGAERAWGNTDLRRQPARRNADDAAGHHLARSSPGGRSTCRSRSR